MEDGGQDWAPYQSLHEACAVYLRDATVGLAALSGVLDLGNVLGFVLNRESLDDKPGLYQEIAVVDGNRLVIWIGTDAFEADDDEEEAAEQAVPIFESELRVIPFTVMTGVSLEVSYRVRSLGRELYAARLSLGTAIPDYAKAKTPEKTELYCEELNFSKSVHDGGRAQVERLVQFGKLVSARV